MINLDTLMLTFCVCCLLVGIGVAAVIRGWYKHWNERWSDNEEDTEEDTEEETDEAFAAAVQAAEIRQREEMALRDTWLEKKGAKK